MASADGSRVTDRAATSVVRAGSSGLVDGYGRVARDLRISVTDVCNLRCRYCLPDEQIAWLPREQRLDDDELVRIVTLLARMGVRTVRITGGEPLVRPKLPALVERIAAVDGIEEIALTTNGVLLARHAAALAAAGVSRVNVSMDSVDPQRFAELTRRDLLPKVLEGIATARATPGIEQVKINAVAMRGITEHEAVDLVAFARAQDLQLRFIEVMPLDAGHRWQPTDVLTAEELRGIIGQRWAMEPLERAPSSTARVFRFADGGGEVGFIASVSEAFCADCDRLRLTADGQLRTCLFAHDETDLRSALRDGADDERLAALITGAVADKQWGHEIHRPGFRPPARSMSAIGG